MEKVESAQLLARLPYHDVYVNVASMDEVIEPRTLCGHPTVDGKRCRNRVERGEARCWLHADSFSHKWKLLSRSYPIGFGLTVFFGIVTTLALGIEILDHYTKVPILTVLFSRPFPLPAVSPPAPSPKPLQPKTSPQTQPNLAPTAAMFGNLRERTLTLASDIRAVAQMRDSLHPTPGSDRNTNAHNETVWMRGNYTMFHRNFDDRLHDIQREYAGFHLGTSEVDSRIKTMDDHAQSPQQFQIMFDSEFSEWANDLVVLADKIPHTEGANAAPFVPVTVPVIAEVSAVGTGMTLIVKGSSLGASAGHLYVRVQNRSAIGNSGVSPDMELEPKSIQWSDSQIIFELSSQGYSGLVKARNDTQVWVGPQFPIGPERQHRIDVGWGLAFRVLTSEGKISAWYSMASFPSQ